MKENKSQIILALIFLIGSTYLCPMVREATGLGLGVGTVAFKIYLWFGSLFLFVLSIAVLPLPEILKKVVKTVLMVFLVVGSVELAAAIAYKVLNGHWSHTEYMNLNRFMFERHPYLVGDLKKGISHEREELKYEHNSKGYRCEEFSIEKDSTKTRVVAIGGSTTYGVGVNNDETWTHHLGEILGDDHEVINMGVPGYTSAENLIQTALHTSDLKPDVAIYYIGLNDLRNINIKDLASDYSDYHAPALYSALGLCNNENIPSLASLKMFLAMCEQAGILDVCPNLKIKVSNEMNQGPDNRALDLFERNLRHIIALCNEQNIKPIFVPQILLEDVLKTGSLSWWVPYVKRTDLDDQMLFFNERLKSVALEDSVTYVSDVAEHNWTKEDFVDLTHFNPEANRKLAELIGKAVLLEEAP